MVLRAPSAPGQMASAVRASWRHSARQSIATSQRSSAARRGLHGYASSASNRSTRLSGASANSLPTISANQQSSALSPRLTTPHHSYHSLTPAQNSLLHRAALRSSRPPSSTSFVGLSQCRNLFGTSWGQSQGGNRNVLAHMEQTANNHPASATAQNGFYQALLRANMPEIIVERYQTGRYATNAACENTYTKALERIGGAASGSIPFSGGAGSHAPNRHMSNEELQAVGQAISAKMQGGNVSFSKQGTGAKSEPLYVVVDESLGSTIFKWVKFLLYFGLIAYISIVAFTLVIEMTGVLKRVGGNQNAEAKPELQTTKFTDVHGCDEAKEELQELVEFLKAPDQFSTLGGKLPKGVLLVGPPGTGKTLLARAVAGESGVPFFYMSGSEFDEVYVGVGAKRVRDLFAAARGKSPAIIFIDELDAIGSKRHERDAAYAKQTLNQLLTELDGFDQNSGVIIIGATNFPQSLDKALTRPGRFDRNVNVPLPDVRGRIAILKHHMRNIKVDSDVDAAIVARGCPGFSGAELENIINQAAVRASKNKSPKVTMEDLIWAKDKVLMGAERRSAVIQEKDKLMTAYHEGGHALVAMLTEDSTPLYKATIMPRGHALGLTQMLPELDKVSESKAELLAQIDVCMGGKVAEELVYGPDQVTTGAGSDIKNATALATHMVTQAGMSPLLGNVDLQTNYARLSSETKQQIESEVRRLVEEGKLRAHKLLTDNREGLERLAHALVEYETLNKEEIEKVVRGEKLVGKLSVKPSTPVKMPEMLPKPPFSLPPSLGGSDVEGAGGGEGVRPQPAEK